MPQGVGHRLTSEEREAAMVMYQAGVPSEEVARRFGVSGPAIRKLRDLCGIEAHDFREMHRIYNLRQDAFDEINNESAYWIGMLMADGYISDEGRIGLTLSDKDIDVIEQFRSFLGSNMPIRHRVTKKTGKAYAGLSIRTKRICEALLRHGVGPRKSLTAKASDECAGLPDFWRGEIDGDGHIKDLSGCPKVTLVGSIDIIRQFVDFCSPRLGGYELKCHEHKKGGGVWYACLHGDGVMRLLPIIYPENCHPFMKRKEAVARTIINKYKDKTFRVFKMKSTACVARP